MYENPLSVIRCGVRFVKKKIEWKGNCDMWHGGFSRSGFKQKSTPFYIQKDQKDQVSLY
jgi:hypothetical protein